MKKLTEMSLSELWQLFPIILREHNPEYAQWYKEEKRQLLELLTDFEVQRINHTGSTSVEGVRAKPIMDILLEFPSGYERRSISTLLEKNGWILMAENEETETLALNKGYTSAGFAEKVYHLHIRPLGDWAELYFRDYLRKYPEIARQYGELKVLLKEKYEHDRDAYTEAKAAFVRKYSQKARQEFGSCYLAE